MGSQYLDHLDIRRILINKFARSPENQSGQSTLLVIQLIFIVSFFILYNS